MEKLSEQCGKVAGMLDEISESLNRMESDDNRKLVVAENRYLKSEVARLILELKAVDESVDESFGLEIETKPEMESIRNEPVKEEKKASKKKKQKPDEPLPVHVGRLDLRVGHVQKVERHPNADKLFVSVIDVGEEQPRTVCSGLVGLIDQAELENSKVIVLCNLKAAKMRGVKSEAMVMCANRINEDGTYIVEMLRVDGDCASAGDRVFCPGFETTPDKTLSSQLLPEILQKLKTDHNSTACYEGKEIRVKLAHKSEKECPLVVAKSLKNASIK